MGITQEDGKNATTETTHTHTRAPRTHTHEHTYTRTHARTHTHTLTAVKPASQRAAMAAATIVCYNDEGDFCGAPLWERRAAFYRTLTTRTQTHTLTRQVGRVNRLRRRHS